jgi:hypothetical protein
MCTTTEFNASSGPFGVGHIGSYFIYIVTNRDYTDRVRIGFTKDGTETMDGLGNGERDFFRVDRRVLDHKVVTDRFHFSKLLGVDR